MSGIYKYAPAAVINNLSKNARDILEQRLINNTLQPHVEVEYNIRIRGVKPSILYSTYTNLSYTNAIESMYVVETENAQCTWIKEEIIQIKKIPQIDRFIKSMCEMPWCTWEDNFLAGNVVIPQPHLHGYNDYMNNTFVHCISYACANKVPVDINQVEAQFQAFNFTNNKDMYTLNKLYETPLRILCNNGELLCFVESILLRLPPENRLQALPFRFWQKSWGTLLNSVIENQLPLLISQSTNEEGFLSMYLQLTFEDADALNSLFKAGYKLQPQHFYKDTLKPNQKNLLKAAILTNPSWHNYTVILYIIQESPKYQQKSEIFSKMRRYLDYRIGLIKEDIYIKTLNPEYCYFQSVEQNQEMN